MASQQQLAGGGQVGRDGGMPPRRRRADGAVWSGTHGHGGAGRHATAWIYW